MSGKKEDALKGDLAGIKKRGSLKKTVSNIEENEKITKQVYKPSKQSASISKKSKKTTVDMPEDIHMRAKITAMELKLSLKDYIIDLVVADLKKRKKM